MKFEEFHELLELVLHPLADFLVGGLHQVDLGRVGIFLLTLIPLPKLHARVGTGHKRRVGVLPVSYRLPMVTE